MQEKHKNEYFLNKGNNNFTTRKWNMATHNDEKQIQSSEIKFSKSVYECSIIDKIRNVNMRRELKVWEFWIK